MYLIVYVLQVQLLQMNLFLKSFRLGCNLLFVSVTAHQIFSYFSCYTFPKHYLSSSLDISNIFNVLTSNSNKLGRHFFVMCNETNTNVFFFNLPSTAMVTWHKMVEHTQTNRRLLADELFECIWSFCGVGA